MKKHWHMLEPDPSVVKKLSRELNCHPVTAKILANRNILTASDAVDFLTVSLNNLRPPSSLIDMDAAVNRICTAITGNQKILIFGDYDVDGVTSTVILLDFLRYAGADVSYYIPHRINEGYSILPQHISHVIRPNKFDLIITADCGSGSHQAVKAANRFGIDMVITDHHNIGADIPPALAVINPKRHECTAGLQNLAGVGVAFYLLICLRSHLRDKGFWQERPEPNLKNYCDLVALGTVADMVPLIRENRILSKTGLELINAGQRPGLTELLKVSGIRNETLDADDIAFRLAPRLNAAGRLDHASRAVDLLTARDTNFAAQAAHKLNLLNQKRQELEKTTLADIQGYLDINPSMLQRSSLVLSRDGWHAGVLGIVASRIMDKYYRPVVLIATEDGLGKGSARSIPGIDLYAALAACKPYLENFGGHSMAAGLKIREENIADFQTAFEEAVRTVSQPEDLIPKLPIDSELDFGAISADLVDEMESLIPFGAGNPEPLFMSSNVKVVSSKIVGKNHRRMVLRQSSAPNIAALQAIHFNVDDRMARQNKFEKMIFKLRWNRWNGKKTTQIIVEDLL
ncbi:MAG: single-stranded-DNA-specific exonuclease RecJ [Desulfobacterales bacterium]|nr:MAG: single-stranded-DNA-specific exonuclease RecJ [Desulfobacterales bacterium]